MSQDQSRFEQAATEGIGTPQNGVYTSGSDAGTLPVEEYGATGEKELACASCHRPFPPSQLTVTSNQRWNYDNSLVVCPDCLSTMKLDMEAKTGGADLRMASIWALIAFLVTTAAVGGLIWSLIGSDKGEIFETVWLFIGAYLLVVTGFIIGKAVYYGSGRKESRAQRLIAVGFTALNLLCTNYINQIAFLNFTLDIARPNAHPFAYMDPVVYLTNYVFQPVIDLFTSGNILIGLAVVGGSALGLAVAYFTSGGTRLYTRPFVSAQ